MQIDTPLRVLIYSEEGEFIAHLLEMDLVGTGDSPESALTELRGSVDAQLSFCLQNNLSPIHHAPRNLFDAWEKAQEATLAPPPKPFPASSHAERSPATYRNSATYISYSESYRQRLQESSDIFQPA